MPRATAVTRTVASRAVSVVDEADDDVDVDVDDDNDELPPVNAACTSAAGLASNETQTVGAAVVAVTASDEAIAPSASHAIASFHTTLIGAVVDPPTVATVRGHVGCATAAAATSERSAATPATLCRYQIKNGMR